jgi:Membrane domain of glycerophosphoryl diester phosphodiesterase
MCPKKSRMDEPLHPSTLSEMLDRTAQIYRARFLVFLGIAVIPTAALLLPAGGLFLLLIWSGANSSPPVAGVMALLGMSVVMLIAVPVFAVTSALASAGMSHAAARAIFGQPINIRDSYRAVWRRGWRYIGLYLLELVAVWGVPIAFWTLLVFISAMLAATGQSVALSGGAIFVLAVILVVIGLVTYGFWMSLRLSLAFPATIVEQSGVWAAIKRSAQLTTGTKGRIFLLYLLGTVLNWILSFAVTLPFTIAMALMPGINTPRHSQTAGMVLLFVIYGAGFAIQAITRPIYGIALMLFYYDQRIRQEGFDIEWMMFQAGLIPPLSAPPLQAQTAQPAQPEAQPEPSVTPASVIDTAAPVEPAPATAPQAFPDPTPEAAAEEPAPEPAISTSQSGSNSPAN